MSEQDSITEHLRGDVEEENRTGEKPLAEQTEKTGTCDAFGLVKWVDKQSEAQRDKISVPVPQHPVTNQGQNPTL